MGRIKENVEKGMRGLAYGGSAFLLYSAWEYYVSTPATDMKERIFGTMLLATLGILGMVANTLQIRDGRR